MLPRSACGKRRAMGLRHPRRLWALLLLALAGCQPTVYLMPTPVALQGGRIDPFAANPHLKGTNAIHVEYATNRVRVGPQDHAVYTAVFDDALRFGRADVVIGEGELPWEWVHRKSTSAKRDENPPLRLNATHAEAVIRANEPLEHPSPELARYFERLNARIRASAHQDLTVYVHGANNNFYRAIAQAGQFRHFSGYNAVVLAFSWPSMANLFRYGTDVANARATVPVFARLLELLARHSTARHINILAYSAGAQVVSPALALLRVRHADRPVAALRRTLRLGEVYFAAPDVDQKTFLDNLFTYKDMACTVTLALNLNDSVLNLAQSHHGRPRAGRPDPDELSPEETRRLTEASRSGAFQLIDIAASRLPDLSRGAHDFWYNHPWVSNDVLLQFLHHADPAARGLEAHVDPDGAVAWYFPPDYPQRVLSVIESGQDVSPSPGRCAHVSEP